MSAVTNVVGQALIAKLAGNALQAGARKAGNKMLCVLAGFLVCFGAGFLLLAGYWYLGMQNTPQMSALIAGGISLGLAGFIGVGLFFASLIRRGKSKKAQREIESSLRGFLETLDEDLGDPIRANPKTSAAIAFAIGYAAGERAF